MAICNLIRFGLDKEVCLLSILVHICNVYIRLLLVAVWKLYTLGQTEASFNITVV